MNTYLIRNDKIQHKERITLERWYKKQRGRDVPYSEILHDLQHKAVISISPPSK